jgi:hypothetical protein
VIRTATLIALASLSALVMAAAVPGEAGAGPTTFTDPVGDARGGVDLSTVTIGDAANGALGIAFSVTGLKGDSLVEFSVDSDRNPTTGQEGDDYIIDFFDDGTGWKYEVARWSLGTFQPFTGGDASAPGGIGLTAAAEIPRADLGGSNGFDFYAIAWNFAANGTVLGRDDAPDTNRWTFIPAQLTGAQLVRPVVSAPLSTPPVAGKPWTISYSITRSDTGDPVALSSLTSLQGIPTVGGTPVDPSKASYVHGVFHLTFKLKPTDRGKVIDVPLGALTPYQLGWTDTRYTIR